MSMGRMSSGVSSSSSSSSSTSNVPIELHQSKSKGVFLTGGDTLETEVKSVEEALMCVRRGNQRRATASTDANERSSRSHAIVTLHIDFAHPQDPTRIGKRSKLHVIDLAGSERVGLSGATGARLQEAQAINLSLTALSNVLMALSSAKYRNSRNNSSSSSSSDSLWLIPYRNSKLTHLLKDSLGGTALTVFIAHVRSTPDSYRQTMLTLDYASRAKTIKNRAPPTPKAKNASSSFVAGVAADVHARMMADKQREMDTLGNRLRSQQQKLSEMREIEQRATMEAEEQRERLNMLAEALSRAKAASFSAEEKARNHEMEIATLQQEAMARLSSLEQERQQERQQERDKGLTLEKERVRERQESKLYFDQHQKENDALRREHAEKVEEATAIAVDAVRDAEEAEARANKAMAEMKEMKDAKQATVATAEFGTQATAVTTAAMVAKDTNEIATSPHQKTTSSSTSTSPIMSSSSTGTSTTPLPTTMHMATSPIIPLSQEETSISNNLNSKNVIDSSTSNEKHLQSMNQVRHEYKEKVDTMSMELIEARDVANTKTAQYEHASKRAHQQVLLISAELDRTERAIEAQRELCDHLQTETDTTKRDMIRREEEHVLDMSNLTYETQMEMSRKDQQHIHMKRKMLQYRLNDLKQQDAMKRMKRQHKKHVSNTNRINRKLANHASKVNDELTKQYNTVDSTTLSLSKATDRVHSLENDLSITKTTLEGTERDLEDIINKADTLEENVSRLQGELSTSKSENANFVDTIMKMTDEIKSLEEAKARAEAEMMDGAVGGGSGGDNNKDSALNEEALLESQNETAKFSKKIEKQKKKIDMLKDALRKFKSMITEFKKEEEDETAATSAMSESSVEQEDTREEQVDDDEESADEDASMENASMAEDVEEEEVGKEVVAVPPSSKKRKKTTEKEEVDDDDDDDDDDEAGQKEKEKQAAGEQHNTEKEKEEEEELEEEQQQPNKRRKKSAKKKAPKKKAPKKKAPKKKSPKKTTKGPDIYEEDDVGAFGDISAAAPIEPRRSARKRKPSVSAVTKQQPLSTRKKQKVVQNDAASAAEPAVAVKKKGRRKKKLRSIKNGVKSVFNTVISQDGGVVQPKLKSNAKLFSTNENKKNDKRSAV
jgi:hypothetical protein